ncbi:pollen-specific leucine-rich repeat extensin-like protein 4 [Pyrus ussuriensis x Pyrus communis]|uniref:Cell wall hydroxyproline-rich glycoprotein n=1 Tax=Pyrus ussuriensis x Pyrus communis TaxID=2448454 RepID=A0A5N5I8J0_9ROSA|nr:pollen-specific leucine-rich repeat extensin-like protein 4 [Pyrus ussuriensis x Pyrus communis]
MAPPLLSSTVTGCCFLLLSFLISSFPALSFALTDAEAAHIAHRQLISLPENGDLPDNYEVQVDVKLKFENDRLKRAYVALQAQKSAIFSDPFKFTANWEGENVCAYKGVFCAPALDDSSLNVVAGIDLNHADIAGHLVVEMGLLTDLALFHINSNRFCGIIPESFRRLTLMYEFDISNNRFVGRFPGVVLHWPNCKYLDLRFNGFEGELPPELFFKEFDAIFLNHNRFTSVIPETIGNSKVSVVSFAFNNFSGCIPHSVGNMHNVNELIFMNNQLGGCFPPEIGNLGNLQVFDVCYNGFIGSLPKSFVGLQSIEELDIGYNRLTGFVTDKICTLPKLANFTFAYNYFSGEAQNCMPNPKSKIVLDDSGNCMPGRPKQKNTKTCFPVVTKPVDCSKNCGGSSTPEKPKTSKPPTPKVSPPPTPKAEPPPTPKAEPPPSTPKTKPPPSTPKAEPPPTPNVELPPTPKAEPPSMPKVEPPPTPKAEPPPTPKVEPPPTPKAEPPPTPKVEPPPTPKAEAPKVQPPPTPKAEPPPTPKVEPPPTPKAEPPPMAKLFLQHFYPCINSVGGTRAPEARACDYPSLAKGTKGRKPEEVLRVPTFRYCSTAMQVMTIGATSIEEQLAQMNEAIPKLTRTVEEKDLQITTLVNQLEVQHEKVDPKVDLLKREADEEEKLLVKKVEEKLELDQATFRDLLDRDVQPRHTMGITLYPLRHQTTDLRGISHPRPRHRVEHRPSWKKRSNHRLQEGQGVCSQSGKSWEETANEVFTINTTLTKTSSALVKISSKNKAKEIKRVKPSYTQDRYKNILRELEQKTYSFPDSDMDAMLDDLLKKKVIELPECKRLEEMNHINDPRYCRYRLIVIPFTKVESRFVDAKFYMEKDMVLEAFPKEIKSTGKATPKKQEWQAVPKKHEGEVVPSSSKNDDEPAKLVTTKGSTREDNIEKEVQGVFHIMIQEGKEDEIPEEDVTAAPPQLEDKGQAMINDLKELNLGISEEPKPIIDLNDDCPKDNFPLPIIEMMVDATTCHEALSFMNGSSGYNQIHIALEDEELTAFCTPKVFGRLRKYNLKMNPLKCAFGVTSRKFLNFIVMHHGIEVDQSKIKAIQSMPEARDLHELKSLQG